ncbi:MAG: hypothetical protein FK733_01215 [Asgard group archaeon]|nr:hypothetical protein [Asgard group archaeon]
MKPVDNKLILSNGILWLYLKENEAHLFSLGIWFLSYEFHEKYSLANIESINDKGNYGVFKYRNGIKREILLEDNLLIDKSTEDFDAKITPTLRNSLLFRGDEQLPDIASPIIRPKENTFTREGYPVVKYSDQRNKLSIECIIDKSIVDSSYFESYKDWLSSKVQFSFNDKKLNELYQNSLRSLYKLRIQTSDGEIKVAGFPDFPSLFGRDFALSALGEIYLWPEKTREEVLVHFKHIGKKVDIIRNEIEGRAVHEFNYDLETMSGKYKHFPSWYANDSNSLLLLTIFRLARIQNDFSIIENNASEISSLFKHILSLDLDQDGLIEYKKQPGQLLIHQTWRDGGDEIKHPNDEVVTHPIAPLHDQLCYYGALSEIKRYLLKNQESNLDDPITSKFIEKTQSNLGKLINQKYWMPKLNSYALALDGENNQVKVVNSDICLGYYFNAFDKEKAIDQYQAMVNPDRLLDIVGLRTVSKEHPFYSPRKYQRGGVWPWQLALAIAGVRNYNLDVVPLINCLKNISKVGSIAEVYIPDNPNPVPLTSCIDQRWSSAIPWLALIEGLLGLSVDYNNKIEFNPLVTEIDLYPLHLNGFLIHSKRCNLSASKDGSFEFKKIKNKED